MGSGQRDRVVVVTEQTHEQGSALTGRPRHVVDQLRTGLADERIVVVDQLDA